MKNLLAAYSLLASASAHTIFQELWVNGVSAGHTTGIRVPSYDGPITDVTSNDVICNGGFLPELKLRLKWHHTLTSAGTSDSADPIDPGHLGPVMVYLAKVDNALTTTVTGLKWFKIYEDGLDSNLQWAVTRLYNNKGKVSFTMPSCIPSGQYLLRAEIIALHGASSYPGAQLYMECAQINVTGGGSASPSGVSFPGAYAGTDPGIKFQLYYPTPTTYIIPGPTVFKC